MKSRSRRLAWAFVALCAAVSLAVYATFKHLETTFEVTAETETLRVLSDSTSWYLDDVSLSEGHGGSPERVTGMFSIAPQTEIVFERRSHGPVFIECNARNGSVGMIQVGGRQRRLEERIVLTLTIENEVAQPRTALFPIVGEIDLGREVAPGENRASLRSARVVPLGHALVGRAGYRGKEWTLGVGDRFRVTGAHGPSFGVAKVDERAALTVAYRLTGGRGLVSHYGGEGYEIYLTPYDRATNDVAILGIWGVFVAFFGMILRIIAYVDSKDT